MHYYTEHSICSVFLVMYIPHKTDPAGLCGREKYKITKNFFRDKAKNPSYICSFHLEEVCISPKQERKEVGPDGLILNHNKQNSIQEENIMKKLLSITLALAIIFSFCTTAFAVDRQTTVPEGYIGIYTAEDLYNIRNNLSGKYILMNDIDLSVYKNWEPIGTSDSPFAGELNGNGYSIKNMTITIETDATYMAGLFAKTQKSTLKNITVINSDINVQYDGSVSSTVVAGLISGEDYRSDFNNLSATGNMVVSGFDNSYVGGLVGFGFYSYINCASNYSNITVNIESNTSKTSVGGVVGRIEGTSKQIANFGNIEILGTGVLDSACVYVGGIEGDGGFNTAFLDTYNQGNVSVNFSTPETYVGGLSGLSGITKRVYNIGKINLPDNFKGYTGAISGSINMDVFSIGELPHMEDVYYINKGFVPGYSGTTHPDDMAVDDFARDFGEPVLATSQEMKSQNLYKNFDFEKVWTMEENGYPVLKNQPTINVEDNIELTEGDIYNDTIIENEWATSDVDIAIVNLNGEIVAVAAGVATITVNHAYGYTEEITVIVAEKPVDDPKPEPPPERCWIVQMLIDIWKFIKKTVLSIVTLFLKK